MLGNERTGRRPGRMVLAGALALVLAIGACEAPEPTVSVAEVEAAPQAQANAVEGGFVGFTPEMTRPTLTNAVAVSDALHRHYPPAVREAGIGGTVDVVLWIDENGQVARTEVAETSGFSELDEAAERVAEVMEFRPARHEDEPVAVVVVIPITFGLK